MPSSSSSQKIQQQSPSLSSSPVHCNRNHRYNYFSPLLIFLNMLLMAKSSTALLKHAPISSSRNLASLSFFLRREITTKNGGFQSFPVHRNGPTSKTTLRALTNGVVANGNMTSSSMSETTAASAEPEQREFQSSATMYQNMNISDTPLGTEKGELLMDGLDIYTVPASGDAHPLTVYGIGGDESEPSDEDHVLLMLHGRTWSSVPVYHLLGGPTNAQKGYESRSLMEALHHNKIRVYSMDFRGFGGTPADASNSVEPNRCVEDVESVLEWLAKRHGCKTPEKVTLLGWSQGALVAQLTAQRRKPLFSRLILYGSIFDPMIRYPRDPLYVKNPPNKTVDIENTFDAAIEDFTIEGTIPPKAATYFAEAALLADPIKAQWKNLYQFNNCDPARVHVPTLVVAGDQDPYAPLHVQQNLFTNLGRGTDRTWSILSDSDHAVHLLEGRSRFQSVVTSFIFNGKKIGKETVY